MVADHDHRATVSNQPQPTLEDPGKGMGFDYLSDIAGMLRIVIKGRKVALDESDLPSAVFTPRSFSLVFAAPERVAQLIDDVVVELRRKDQISGPTTSKIPMLMRMVLAERRGLVMAGMACGVAHGIINSLGRFLLLRAAIDAVINDALMCTRLLLALGVVVVIIFEGILLLIAKHFFADHIAHYIGG